MEKQNSQNSGNTPKQAELAYWEKDSYMRVVPENNADIQDLEKMCEKIGQIKGVNDITYQKDKNGVAMVKLNYKEKNFEVGIYVDDYSLSGMYRLQHFFPDIEMNKLKTANKAVVIYLAFDKDSLTSYHLQLKVANAIVENKIAIEDESAEKVLSGKWVQMAAASDVPPAPSYLFTVQAVADDDGSVWLHTHGLNRCGLTELEILDSNKKTYNGHYNVIMGVANRLLDKKEEIKPKEPLYIGKLSDKVDLVATLIPWYEAISKYDENLLGGIKDREGGHNSLTSAIFVYDSEEDCKKGAYLSVSIYDDLLEENSLYMLSNEETARMKALAQERMKYVIDAAKKGCNIILKIGLDVDEEFLSQTNNHEHIWFELVRFEDKDTLTAKLLQEPFYIKDLHEGSIGKYAISDITDWIIYLKDTQISPDNVYLLEYLKE